MKDDDGKISIKTIEDSVINKLRKVQIQPTELEDLEIEEEDNFDKIYKGEVSKSGTAILPSKRIRRVAEKINTNYKNSENKNENKNKELHDEKEPKPSLAENKSEE